MARAAGEGESRQTEHRRAGDCGKGVPEAYEVLDKQALAARLGVSVATVSYYLSREAGSARRLPVPDGRVSGAPYWYRMTVEGWLRQAEREEERIRRENPPRLPRGRVGGPTVADTPAVEGQARD